MSAHPYLTVASYPLANALAVTRAASARSGMVALPVGGGGVAFYEAAQPTNGYLAFPGRTSDRQQSPSEPGRSREA